jgi:integrase/recombinase XerD
MLKEAIRVFLEFKTPNTQRAYRQALDQLEEFLQVHASSLSALTAEMAMAFLASQKQRRCQDGTPITHATIANRLSALRAVYQHLVETGLIDRNPWAIASRLLPAKTGEQKRPTRLIPFEKIEKLLKLPDLRTYSGVRDRAMLALLFGCGLRRSELRGLNVGDVKVSSKGTLYVDLLHTKGGKSRKQPIPAWASESFSSLISQRKSEGATVKDALFVFYYRNNQLRDQDRLVSESIYHIFRRYCRRLDIDAAPHSARATAATRLLEKGVPDRGVAQFLGHANVSMVQVYDKRRREVDENPGKTLDFHD